jgi:hypothetical protein
MRNRRILAGAGYFTPERRNTTVVGAVWIDFTVRLDEVVAVKRCLTLGRETLAGLLSVQLMLSVVTPWEKTRSPH